MLQGSESAQESAELARCSARGCRSAATIDLSWRNPSLHDLTRVKHWVSCDEHEAQLADFLDRRGFLLGREPLAR
jgi:hypothetical protein